MRRLILISILLVAACGDDVVSMDGSVDSGLLRDASVSDAGTPDTGSADAGPTDLGSDAGLEDVGPPDAGPLDTGPLDTGPLDTGPIDSGLEDAGAQDAATPDAGCPRPALQGTATAYTGPAPIAYYTFDDVHRVGANVLDVVGTPYDGLANSSAEAGLGLIGPVGEAASLDGTASLITADPPKNNSTVSAAMWIHPTAWPVGERKVILNQGNGPSAWQGWGFSIRPTGVVVAFIEGGGGLVNEHVATSSACVNYGEWTHIAMSFDGSAVRFYQNGVLQQTTSANLPTLNYGSNGLVLGYHSYFQNAYYDGAVDEVAIFDQVLTEAEIGEIYLAGRDGLHFTCPSRCGVQSAPSASIPTNQLVAWYRADRTNHAVDGRVCSWCDQSPVGNDLAQSDPALQPEVVAGGFGAQPTLQFPLVGSQFLTRPGDLTITSTSGRTFVTVYRLLDTTSRTRIFDQGLGGSPGTFLIVETNTFNSTTPSYSIYVTNNAYQSDIATTLDPVIHTMRMNSMTPGLAVLDEASGFINGVPMSLLRTPGGLGNTLIEALTSSAVWVGPTSGGAEISEILVYSRPLSEPERLQVEDYLAARYGITRP